MVFLGLRSSNYYRLHGNIFLRVQTPLCPTVEVYGWHAVIPESSRTLNDVRDLITLIVFTNKNCKYVFAVIYDGVWEDILGKA